MYLYGAGSHCKVVIDVLRSNGIEVLNVFDDRPSQTRLKDVIVRSSSQLSNDYLNQLNAPFIITVGNNSQRAKLVSKLQVNYGQAIHKTALISAQASIGEGTVVLHRAVLQTDTKIGKHALINTAAIIDHDNIIGDYVHISPHATLCGHVKVDEGTHIGASAVVIPSIHIGKWCTIGAGTVVIRDVPDYATVVGNPGRIIKIQNTALSGTLNVN